MRVVNRLSMPCLAGIAVVLLALLAAIPCASSVYAGLPDWVTEYHPWADPPAGKQVSLGVDDDGRTVYVGKGDQIQFTFVEYGSDDSWHMRANQGVQVVSDLVRESYPMQHVMTVNVLAPTVVWFDRTKAPDGGKKTVRYTLSFSGVPTVWPGGEDLVPVPDPTFDVPPVVINGATGWQDRVKVPDSIFEGLPEEISKMLRSSMNASGLVDFKPFR